MRKHVKTIKNLQKRDYVNMYIVYLLFLKNFEILRNIVTICKKLSPATLEGIIRYKLGTGLHCFYLSYFEIFQKKCIPKSFERLRFFRKISRQSQFFQKICGMQFFSKDFIYLFC